MSINILIPYFQWSQLDSNTKPKWGTLIQFSKLQLIQFKLAFFWGFTQITTLVFYSHHQWPHTQIVINPTLINEKTLMNYLTKLLTYIIFSYKIQTKGKSQLPKK
jgi:hypothetical protein